MLNCCDVCGHPQAIRRKFQDPRRGEDEEIVYLAKFVCSNACEENLIDNLERQANYARLVC